MGDEQLPDPNAERVDARAARPLPEEERVGTDDAQAQAEAILAESDLRQDDRDAAPDASLEHRRSEDTVEPS